MSTEKCKVLVITNAGEVSVGHVLQWLDELKQPYVRLNVDGIADKQTHLSLSLNQQNLVGLVDILPKSLDLGEIKSVWYRRPEQPKLKDATNPVIAKFVEDEFQATLWSLYTCLDGYWMDRPLQGRHLLEHNKLYQLKLASQVDLKVPETLVTNDADRLIRFCEEIGGEVALKVLRSRIFQTNEVDLGIYTNRVSLTYLKEHRDQIVSAPMMAQEYVQKQLEFRVTVVGRKIFTCAIHSQDSGMTKDDWRHYDFANVKHEPYQLPSEIESKLFRFMDKCGLHFGAIDMILTPEGEYVFLEVNPNGQFGWIEGLTAMPISKAIAEALTYPIE